MPDVPVEECISVRLYGAGKGDPVITDRGFAAYDVLRDCWREGTFGVDDQGVPQLEYVPEVGLVCRPYPVLRDNLLATWSTSGGTWSAVKPLVGTPRPTCLMQASTTAVGWRATSAFELPQNPTFGVLLFLADVPAGETASTTAGVVTLQFGGGRWGLQWHPQEGLRLLRYKAATGLFEAVADIPEPGGSLGANVAAMRLILVRYLRGKVLVSTDRGKTYTVYTDPAGQDLTVAKGPLILSGSQRVVVFGLVEIAHYEGTWTSPARRMGKSRMGATLTVTPWTLEPTGTSVAGADVTATLHGDPSDKSSYKLTLTPEGVQAGPIRVYRTPEVYGCTYEYPIVTTAAVDAYTTPWDDNILSATLRKPEELDQTICEVEALQAAPFDFGADSWKWRKVLVRRGTHEVGAAVTMADWYVGRLWVLEVIEGPAEPDYVRVHLELLPEAVRAKRWFWEASIPFGGQTVNTALGDILDRLAVPAGSRSLDSTGDDVTLPRGAPEEPAFASRRGEAYWDTLTRIAGHAGLEIGCTDTGTWYTLPKGTVGALNTHTWKAPATAYRELQRRVRFRFDSGESFTAIRVVGKDAVGRPVAAYVDGHDEADTSSTRYSPWPEVYVEELPDTTSAPAATDRCVYLFDSKYPLRFEAEVEAPFNPDIGRLSQVQLEGSGTGVVDNEALGVRTVEHRIEGVDGEQATVVTARRDA